MRVLVLGGTGRLGQRVAQAAMAAGHHVKVLAREPFDPPSLDGNIEIAIGDATVPAAIKKATIGIDVILNTIGSRDYQHPIEHRVTQTLLPVALESGVHRLIVCSAFGVGATLQDAAPAQQAFFSSVLRNVYASKEEADTLVSASPINWTLVYPTRLTDDLSQGAPLAVERFIGAGQISRIDTAAFMVNQIESAAWSRKRVIITSDDQPTMQ